jgi:outer membrane protein assembly factor BamB
VEKTKINGEHNLSVNSYGTCQYDQQSTLTCQTGDTLTGYDAKTAQKLWSLPDQATNRVAPSSISVAWHGALYGTTQDGQPIVLDAKTGKDLSTDVGAKPTWVSKYAAIGAKDENHLVAYPVRK